MKNFPILTLTLLVSFFIFSCEDEDDTAFDDNQTIFSDPINLDTADMQVINSFGGDVPQHLRVQTIILNNEDSLRMFFTLYQHDDNIDSLELVDGWYDYSSEGDIFYQNSNTFSKSSLILDYQNQEVVSVTEGYVFIETLEDSIRKFTSEITYVDQNNNKEKVTLVYQFSPTIGPSTIIN